MSDDQITKYYKLKQRYEDKIKRLKMRIIRDPNLSSKDKRARVNMIKKECIACKRSGGTVFAVDGNDLIATCGHTAEPCDLDLRVPRGKYVDVRELLNRYQKLLNKRKVGIIRTKLDLLFANTDEKTALEKFESLKNGMDRYSSTIEMLSDHYIKTISNNDKLNKIKSIENEFFVMKEELSRMIAEYKEDSRQELLVDIVQLYTERLLPTAESLRNLEYTESRVDRTTSGEVILVEEPFTLSSLFLNLDDI